MITKVISMSICQCGFPLFNDDIKLGQEYWVDPTNTEMAGCQCGGCGIVNPARYIAAVNMDSGKHGSIPMQALDL